jgi:hypothetical protein
VFDRAFQGDAEAQATITAALDRKPAYVARVGSFMARTEKALLDATSDADWTLRETRTRTLRVMVRDIAGPNPTPLEAALAHCFAMSFTEADHLATVALRARGSTDEFDRRRTRAHARAMSAARTLATVRRLALPVVQVNVAQRQVNVATAALPNGSVGDGDDG